MTVGRVLSGRSQKSDDRSSIILSAGQGLTAVASSVALVVTARSLGAEGRGTLAIIQNLASISVAVGILGFPTLVLRRVQLGVEDRMLRAWGLAALSAICFIAAIASFTSGRLTDTLPRVPEITLLLVSLSAVYFGAETYAASLQRQARFVRLAASRTLWTCAAFTALSVASAATQSLTASLWAFIAAYAGALGLLRTTDQFTETLVYSGSRLRQIAPSILHAHASLLLLLLVYRLDVVLLGILSSAKEVGFYSVAYAAAELAWLFVNGHAITLMSRATSTDLQSARQHLTETVQRSLLICAAITGVGIIVGHWLIPHVFGSSFSRSYWAFVAITPGILAFIPFKLQYSWAISRGQAHMLPPICIVMIICNIGTLIPLASSFGAIGAAASASATYVLGAMMLAWRLRR